MTNRLDALKLAVATQGNSNKLELAATYLKFLDEGAPALDPTLDKVAPLVTPVVEKTTVLIQPKKDKKN